MWYWIVMLALAAGCIVMLSVSAVSIRKNKVAAVPDGRRGRGRYDEEEEEYEEPVRRSRRQQPPQAPAAQERRAKKQKLRWKILMEDIDSWDKYSFTFYDSVGIGRSQDGNMYEKFLPIIGDGRVSKLHCVILRRGDKLYVKDEGSRNGTYLNGVRIDRPVVIQRDDIIGIGETRLEIQKILRESPEPAVHSTR